MRWIEGKLEWLFQRLGAAAWISPRAASGYRILLGLFLLVFFMPSFSWVAEAPPTFYFPQRLSIYHYLPGVPPVSFMR